MRSSFSLGLTAGLLTALLSSTSAYAQSAAEGAAAANTDEIVVTARRRAESVQDVPVTVAVMNSAALETRGIRSEADLQGAFPGLVIRSSNVSNQLNYVIRGESVDAYSGSPPGVQPYVNDVPFLVSQATAFFDLDNVQVVKGPQGTLFGRNSTGGAVLFQTKQPTDEFEGYASIQYGNLNRLVTEAALNLPMGEKAGLRLAGSVTSGGAYVRNLYNNEKLGNRNERSGRATLKLEPVEGLTNSTMVQISRSHGTSAPNTMYYTIPCGQPSGFNSCLYSPSNPDFVNLINGNSLPGYPAGYVFPGGFEAMPEFLRSQGDYVVNANANFKFKSSSDLIINRTEYEFSDALAVKNIFGYSRAINKINYDTDYSPYPIIGQNIPTLPLNGPGLDIETGKTRNYSNELQFSGKTADSKLTYLAGLFYIRSTENYLSPLVITTLAAPVVSIPVAYNAKTGNTSKAIFGQLTYKLADATNLTVGGRYTWEKITLVQLDRSVFGVGQPQKAKQDNPSWTVSLDHHFNRDIMVYATTRGSWRRGGFNPFNPPTPTPQTAATGAGGNYFLPEKIIDIELGAKYDGRIGDMPVRANVAVYNNWVKNIQKTAYVVVAGTASSAAVNVPRTKIRGYEGELYLKPADWLTMGGSLTYTDAKFTKNQSIVFGLPVFYGPFGDVPKWSGSVYADAKMELPNDLGSLNYHVDIYAQTAFYFSNLGGTIQPGTRLPGYELVNMRLDWANMFGSNVKGGIFVKNLTDKLYYTGGSAGAQNFSVESATFGSPRTYGVSMRIDF